MTENKASAGEALWALLTAGVKSKAITPAKPKPKVSQADLWRNEALVLIIHTTTCQCCGAFSSMPNGSILLRASHPKLGIHYSDISASFADPARIFHSLPLIKEYRNGVVQWCETCWDRTNFTQLVPHATKRDPLQELFSCPSSSSKSESPSAPTPSSGTPTLSVSATLSEDYSRARESTSPLITKDTLTPFNLPTENS